MIEEISVTVLPENEKNMSFILNEACNALNKKGIKASKKDITLVFVKKSVDARRKQVKLVLRYKAYIGEKPGDSLNFIPKWKKADSKKSVLIIGAGPAGLFGALRLLEYGIKPVIIERGQEASPRKRDIAAISTKGIVGEDSNYCFGEGGAGTFSDGKLYTRSNKRGNISEVLSIFHYFGADKKILTDAHPHIGTDKLPAIITAMRNKIIELGGEVHFNTRCTQLITEENNGTKTVKGIKTIDVFSNEEKQFMANAVLVATGHSAVDIYEMIGRCSKEALEAKTFAMGVRVEHPRTLIDEIQYHGKRPENLGAAEYRLVSQQNERGVYSFCMCPGGFVVPSATAPNQIVVNGMSSAGRNSAWSNAAIVIETRPEDIPEEFVKIANEKGIPQLAGLYYRTWLEEETYRNGDGQKAPAQRMEDFLDHKDSTELPHSSYAPGLVPSRLDKWLPTQISDRLASGFKTFNFNMKGFISKDALLIASETRTSTPVRITRNKESGECESLKNLYPAGEGSGYSGGIVSSAMDGQNLCVLIAKRLGL